MFHLTIGTTFDLTVTIKFAWTVIAIIVRTKPPR